MRLLILGGTAFLGRAVAAEARAAGHVVTCAARGESGAPPEGVAFVRVDRDEPDALAPLGTAEFDAVVDVTSRPSHARHAVSALADRVDHWSYVSTCSVYADQTTPGQRADSAPVVAAAPPDVDDPVGEQYGPCKVACEEAMLATGRAYVCRAGLIVGPGDDSGRFLYWPSRLARGGEVLAPGRPDNLVQWVDVRDLAAWLVRAAEARLTGVYDGIGAPVGFADFLARVARGVGVEPALTWVDQEFLTAHEVRPWAGERSLPMWLPLPEYAGFLSRDVSASLAAGLATRDVAETARDTLAWVGTLGADDRVDPFHGTPWPGLTAEDEAALLADFARRTA